MMFQCDKCGAIVDPPKGKPHRVGCPTLGKAMTPPPLTAAAPNTHAERMASMLQDWAHSEPDELEVEYMAMRAYADSLAAQLEAERAKVATLDKELDRLDTAIDELCDACDGSVSRESALDWVGRTKARLQAAERVISVAKTWARDMADIEARGLPPRSWDVPLVEAVADFDAINPDTSTGGAGEGDAKETP